MANPKDFMDIIDDLIARKLACEPCSKESREILHELDNLIVEQRRETREIRIKARESSRRIDERIKQTDERIKQQDERIKQTDERIKQQDERIKQTDERIKQQDKQHDELMKRADEVMSQANDAIKQSNEKSLKAIGKQVVHFSKLIADPAEIHEQIKSIKLELHEQKTINEELREMLNDLLKMIQNFFKNTDSIPMEEEKCEPRRLGFF